MNRLQNLPTADPSVVNPRFRSRDYEDSAAQMEGNAQRLVSQSHMTDVALDTVALVLAGGRGNRLHPLTVHRCKPAVPFGGCCRIIDFTLSNCINSGICRVGVLTQYEQNSLIQHLQEGWNFLHRDRNEFIDVLPAQQHQGAGWYRGTADAIARNLDMLIHLSPRYTLILAGDHIYKADYRRMIQQHQQTNADVTIACCEVPIDTADQFGIVETDCKQRINRFQEKPAFPIGRPGRSDVVQASMGIYLFKTTHLLNKLINDSTDPDSSHDFGRDIIPSMIKTDRVFAYEFERAQAEHYWRDVGTIDAYYEANMQLLDPLPSMELNNRDWPIHTGLKNTFPAQFVADSLGHSGLASDCIVASGCIVRGSRVRHSILFSDVQVNEQTQIEGSLVLPGAVIGKRCRIRNAIIDSGTHIEDDSEIGYDHHLDDLLHSVSKRGIVVVSPAEKDTRHTLPHLFANHPGTNYPSTNYPDTNCPSTNCPDINCPDLRKTLNGTTPVS